MRWGGVCCVLQEEASSRDLVRSRGLGGVYRRRSLRTGTVAVLAGGLDIVYPEENRELQNMIAAEGALVTEMPPGTSPQARHFPRRNRLISGRAVPHTPLTPPTLVPAQFSAVPAPPLPPTPPTPHPSHSKAGK